MSPAAARGPRRPPVERVRVLLRSAAGPEVAQLLPSGYQRLGSVLLVRWPEALRPYFPLLAEGVRRELGVRTVLRHLGPIEGDRRTPRVEALTDGPTETEVVEHGVRWRFDAARIMFAAGNRTERVRAGRLVHPGETVVDLFAGIGYFTIPAALPGRAERVWAVDHNPLAAHYLRENLHRNRVAERVTVVEGDNRTAALPPHAADRVFLGYLPSAVPWIPRALELARSDGAWLHVHAVEDADDATGRARAAVARAIDGAGGSVLEGPRAREVKAYGPGRTHMVVDVRVRPTV